MCNLYSIQYSEYRLISLNKLIFKLLANFFCFLKSSNTCEMHSMSSFHFTVLWYRCKFYNFSFRVLVLRYIHIILCCLSSLQMTQRLGNPRVLIHTYIKAQNAFARNALAQRQIVPMVHFPDIYICCSLQNPKASIQSTNVNVG